MDDKSLMPFGVHKGKRLIDVPASYLLFIYDNKYSMTNELKFYIEDNLEVLRQEK